MSLTTLVLFIGTIAILLTLVSYQFSKSRPNWILHFLQFFSGTLFLVSGYVKAVDPIGTALKMEQYFAEFEATFEPTWLSFLSKIFPILSEGSIWVALIMVILEIFIGLTLITGLWKKFTAWAFFLIILFFTVLTGFTYLTGFVPTSSNFFSFSEWGVFAKSNMRVTDCGCFGDFIKLDPRTSFFKDVFLLIPAIYFLFSYRSFIEIFKPGTKRAIVITLTLATILFCIRNVWMGEPVTDFRPFTPGVDIKAEKEKQDEALMNVPMTMVIKNKATGEVVKMDQDAYMKVYKDYPKDAWEYLDPEVGEPDIPITKIREFEISNMDGEDATYEILDFEGYQFLIVSPKLILDGIIESTVTVLDTLYAADTIVVGVDTLVNQRIEQIDQRTIPKNEYEWNSNYLEIYKDKIMPLVKAASQDELPVRFITAFSSPEILADLKDNIGLPGDSYQADDILIKTIMRSNPGVLLLKNGTIINKWHHRKLPEYQNIKQQFMGK